ncbi:MAG: hypothetical protein H6779_00010 [Candidatus Nomurabacteria bacterium]|nr:MAG: hypothetical protein H6779_00010 [Candidatus Nomurabacteria bacterium]
MNSNVCSTIRFGLLLCVIVLGFFSVSQLALAKNIVGYSDLLSDSSPSTASNHTLSFTLNTTISPGSYIEVTLPSDFETLGTSTFAAERNVELYVDGSLRDASSTLDTTVDLVQITPGTPGLIRYTLNPTVGISSGSKLELRIGNNTSKRNVYSQSYATSTGTTTVEADVKPIVNGPTTGNKKVQLRIYDGAQIADADFVIYVIDSVTVGPVDTTEEIPPLRFNGSPTTTITGITANVEIFLETDEFAICKWDSSPNIDYYSMSNTFSGTGLLYHTHIVPVIPGTLNTFYVRCIDDEGNFNIDDYLIQFAVSDKPTGTANTDGNIAGDGTGSGNDGTGTGTGGGGISGSSDGASPGSGNSSGGGGSGGGSGGGTGGGTGSKGGGGFESPDAPYRSGDARVIISGYAYPNSEIVALVDGTEAIRDKADAQGIYSITIDNIAKGVYTFGVYAIDSKKNKSSTFSTSFTVSGGRTSELSNINISPSMVVTPDPVTPGQTLQISGYALPNAKITLENVKDGGSITKIFSTNSDGSGAWSTALDTSGFSVGTYKLKVKAEQDGAVVTNFSTFLFYGVGQKAVKPSTADLNVDGKVNLVDFSILLFWWNTDGGNSNPSADINGDGKVSLTDFSILLFNWTG